MIPIKILCSCGQKYAFDIEPDDGRISQAVQCPVCGTDGTTAANQLIAQHLAANSAPASGLRIGGQQHPATVPLPPRNLTAAARDGNFSGMKVRNKWFIPGLGAAVVSVLAFVGAVMFGRSPERKYESAMPSTEGMDGLPQTLAELNAWYVEPPSGQNAATFYSQGFDALQIPNVHSSNLPLLGKGQLPPLGNPMPAPMKSALAALVKSNRDALQWFAEGAKFNHCRYPVDLTLGYDALFPHSRKLDIASALLELSAIYHAEANQAEQAASDVLNCLALANSLAAEPAVLSQLPRTWSVAYALAALEQTVNRTALPAGVSSELSKVFKKMERCEARGEGFSRAMIGEHALSLAALADPKQLLRGMAAPDLRMAADRRSEITARLQSGAKLTAEREYLDTAFRRLMAARQAPFPDRLKSDELGRQLVAEAASKKLVVLDLLLPSLGRRTTAEAECLARLRLGWTAVALEQFRAAHSNRYPSTLSELTPEYLSTTPADPFNGQPLRYQKKGIGYALYSIGSDLKDDSGERKNGKNGDIVFTVVTPARSGL
jgi:hypothetical protein